MRLLNCYHSVALGSAWKKSVEGGSAGGWRTTNGVFAAVTIFSISVVCLAFDDGSVRTDTSRFDIPGLIDLPHVEGRSFDHYPVPNAVELAAEPQSEMKPVLDRYRADRDVLNRYSSIDLSPTRRAMMRQFYEGWFIAIESIEFDSLSLDGKIDYILFRNRLEYEIRQIAIDETYAQEMSPLLPFAPTIINLEESRVNLHSIDPEKAAQTLSRLAREINGLQAKIASALSSNGELNVYQDLKQTVGNRAVGAIDRLKRALDNWYRFHNSYDPEFTWWNEKPYAAANKALDDYANFVRDKIVRVAKNDRKTIIGDPIGHDALMSELAYEMIPYTPEDLIDIANKEYAWCETEMIKASRKLGYGDDWHQALEYVKTLHVKPGEQPAVIRDLAFEAVDFLEAHDLVTVPELAKNVWRMDMMSQERQRYTPFFTGGEVISVAFPTDGMEQDQKVMAMRRNNVHFSRATVFHELIPGHHLQGFMNPRNHSYRSMFRTPFSVEGWALYWEMLMWDEGFAKSPENRIGMLFWRMHRCARIIFSLSYHLEKMSPQQCIDFLVEKVGHERSTAQAEVRRSVAGGYGPLYQCAYMVGGLQFRALHHDLVDSGKMTNRVFHDAILKENAIPVEMVRAKLSGGGKGLVRDFKAAWRFYE